MTENTLADGKTINEGKALSKYKDPEYVRVSTVLKVISKGERMTHWYYKFDSFKEMMENLRKSAERGSKVDNMTKELMLGNEVEVPPEYQPYIDAFKKWQAEWSFNLMHADQEVSDEELKYVGTLDLYGTLRPRKSSKEEYVVIDVKTGVPTRSKEGEIVYEIYPNMHWQTAAYAHAFKKVPKKVDGTYILRLFSDGNYLFEPDKDPRKSFTIFKHALGICQLAGPIK